MVKHDFLHQQAPENYVAGLGRGATGFTTRSDLGPAREGPSEDQIKEALAKRAAALGTGESSYGAAKKEDEDDNEIPQDPENEVGLFANGVYDRDDDEADRIYQYVDEKMDKRRRIRRLVSHLPLYVFPCVEQIADLNSFFTCREAREKAEREEFERNNPKIQQQFADLKRALGTVTDEDWANIPEVGDLTGRNKRAKRETQQRFYAVPDSVLAGANAGQQMETSINEDGSQTNGDSADGTMTNFADIGAARNKVLQVRLDQATNGAGETSGTSTSVDPKGYLTSLAKSEMAQTLDEGNITRVRKLLDSVVKSNPKHAPGWIAAARLEETAGKIVAARNLMREGCERCPKSEDIWLENMRMNDTHNAKIIAMQALKLNDRSTPLWLEAANLETDVRAKKRVLRKALDHIPQSVAIWKAAVNLEDDPADARLLLSRATEIVPLSVELWLALARQETPDQAQIVLNKARKAIPTSHEIWIAAARLQEQMGETSRIDTIMRRGVQSLAKESAMLKREEWVTEAEKCEADGGPLTAAAIINCTLGYGLDDDDDDRKNLWIEEAKASTASSHFNTARAILAYCIRVFPTSRTVWTAAAQLEHDHGTKESLVQVLEKAVEAVPQSAPLWLQLARVRFEIGEIDEARRTLGRAFKQNPGQEDIWLSAVKLESDIGHESQAKELLATAREEAGTDRVWIKSVSFERALFNTETALSLVNDGLKRYPRAAKLHMMKGQIYELDHDPPLIPQAREAYSAGTRACPNSVPLYLLLSRLEERAGLLIKARSVLDRGRNQVPKNAQLWAESVRIEERAGDIKAAQSQMARGMQEVPAASSGPLWAERIWHLEPRNQRKSLALEAIKKVDNDAVLFVTVARIFWGERRIEKAATWFEKAVLQDPDIGDTWAWYLKFLEMHGEADKRADVVSKCVAREPKHGEVWQRILKDPKNSRKETKEILEIVKSKLE